MDVLKIIDLFDQYFNINFSVIKNTVDNRTFDILKKYVSKDCEKFDVKKFLKEQTDLLGLFPNELRELNDEELCSILKEYEKKNNHSGTFVKICLEKLFNSRFREKFDEKTDSFLQKEEKKNINFDVVNDFLTRCGNSYAFNFENEDRVIWDFSYAIGGKKEIGQRKAGDKVEKIDNPYSAFKLFGQGEYSKLFIAYQIAFPENEKIGLSELTNDKWEIIMADLKIMEALYNRAYEKAKDCDYKKRIKSIRQVLNSNTSFKQEKDSYYNPAYENYAKQIFAIENLLQSRFQYYSPLELDGKYDVSNGNITLRDEIIANCTHTRNKAWKEVEEKKDLFDKDQLSLIKNLFIQSVTEIGLEKCFDLTKNYIFKNYGLKELTTKESLKRIPVSNLDLFEILLQLEDQGFLKNTKNFDRLKNSYHINGCSSLNEIIEADLSKNYDERDSEIGICNLLKREFENKFEPVEYSFLDFIYRWLNEFENNDYMTILDNNTDRTDVFLRAVKKLNKNFNISDIKNKQKIRLSKDEEADGTNTYSLKKFLRIGNNDQEKLWFIILFESFRGSKNPWRELFTQYKNRVRGDNINMAEECFKGKMEFIYRFLIDWERR